MSILLTQKQTLDLTDALITSTKEEEEKPIQCKNCDAISLHVLHLDLHPSEGIFIHENIEASSDEKIYRITDIASTQHQTKTVKIRYQTGNFPGCGFAFRLSFNRALMIPTVAQTDRLKLESESDIEGTDNFTTEANLGLWGILICSGFMLLLIVASIINCRSGSDSNEKDEKPHSSTQETEIIMDESLNRSPQKIKPNAASFALAQHQLRLMKQGQSTGEYYNLFGKN